MSNLKNFPDQKLLKKKGPERIYIDEYHGLTYAKRIKKAAEKASNNGECWWVYKHIMSELGRKKDD
tara:strand:+ start:702 stop:899 length:198 start_codon:yes stop_codon:yes gene_type:complete